MSYETYTRLDPTVRWSTYHPSNPHVIIPFHEGSGVPQNIGTFSAQPSSMVGGEWVGGPYGNCVKFDHVTGQGIFIDDSYNSMNPVNGTVDLGFMMQINLGSRTRNTSVFGNRKAGEGGYVMIIDTGGGGVFVYSNGASTDYFGYPGGTFPANTDLSIQIDLTSQQFTPGTLTYRMWVNGVGIQQVDCNFFPAPSNSMIIGNDRYDEYLGDLTIYDFRVYRSSYINLDTSFSSTQYKARHC